MRGRWKGKAGASRKTHYALRQAGESDNGVQSRNNSIPPCCKLWTPMDEQSGNVVNDVAGGLSWDMAVKGGTIAWGGSTDANSDTIAAGAAEWRLGSSPFGTGATPDSGSMPQPGTDAWVFCHLQYVGALQTGGMRYGTQAGNYFDCGLESSTLLQIYINNTIVPEADLDGDIPASSINTIGSWNMFAIAVSKGDGQTKNATGYVNGVVAGTDTISVTDSTYNFQPSNSWAQIGLTGWTKGAALFVFSDGLPNDVVTSLNWMRTEWLANNKVIYPGWSSLV